MLAGLTVMLCSVGPVGAPAGVTTSVSVRVEPL